MSPSVTPTFVTTLDYCDDPRWVASSRLLTELPTKHTAIEEFRQLLRVLWGVRREPLVHLCSSTGRYQPDLLAAVVLGLLRPLARDRAVVISGCMWQPDSGLRGRIQRLLVRLADRAVVRYAVQSTEEITVFPQTWGVSADKVRFTPLYATLTAAELAAPKPPVGDHVFAGGNSHRDYDALLQAAELLPEREFVIATNLLEDRELPPNVTAAAVPHSEFVRLMQSARVVVVPMVSGLRRSTGQQTYLNAMVLGKPTVVTDTLGVRDHVRDGETGLVVSGTAQSYASAISWAFDPENAAALRAMSAMAAADVSGRLSFAHHVEALLTVINDAAVNRECGASMSQRPCPRTLYSKGESP